MKTYTVISNDTLKALVKFNISLEGLKVFLAVVRQIWGEGKIKADISLNLLSTFTELSIWRVKNTLKKLQKARMIIKDRSGWLSSNFSILPVSEWLKYR